jgi:hypothetical protein
MLDPRRRVSQPEPIFRDWKSAEAGQKPQLVGCPAKARLANGTGGAAHRRGGPGQSLGRSG